MTTGDRTYPSSSYLTQDPATLASSGGGLPDGSVVTTSAPRAGRWTLARNYAVAPDGIRAVAAVGGGAWVRDLAAGAPGANFVPAWFVNQAAGDNLADGFTSGTAVEDLEEVMARLGQQPIDDTYAYPGVVVTVAAGYSRTSKVVLSPRIERGGYLTVQGVADVVASGTLSSHTAWAPGSGTVGSYTAAGFTPGSHVGAFVRTGLGLTSPIAKASGASFRGLFCDQTNFVSAEPTNADTLDVLSLPSVDADVVLTPSGDGFLFVQGFDLGAVANHSVTIVSGNVAFLGCVIRGLDAQRSAAACNVIGSYTLDCRCHGTSMLIGASVHASGGGAILAADNGGLIQILDLTLAEGTVQAGRSEQDGGNIIVVGGTALAIADYLGAGVLVRQGGQFDAYDTVFLLDAVAGAYGYQVLNGGAVYYVAGKLPVFYGTAPAGTGYRLGGADVAANALPQVTSGGAAFELVQ